MDNLGQLIITGISGLVLTDAEKSFIETHKVGGVYLQSHNVQDPAQLAELVNNIQKLRDEYPILIAVDATSGQDSILKGKFSQFPIMQEIAKLDSPKLMFEVYQVLAKELGACGVNLVLSPSCDIQTNSSHSLIAEKSYGSTIESVEKFVSAAIRGLQTNGLLSCAKHFPGLGNSSKNHYHDLPLLKESLQELKEKHLPPFNKASKSRVEFFMMGHAQADGIDEKHPTTISPAAYELLRTETKFTKLIMTDLLDVRSLTQKYTITELSLKALTAGADVLFFQDIKNAQVALEFLSDAVKKKLIKKDLLLEKLLRMEKVKKEYFKEYQPIYIPKITEAFQSVESKKVMAQLLAK